jgi:hypothetical protein
MNLPSVIPHDKIRSFAYYWRGQVRTGMMVGGKLYGLYRVFSTGQRDRAYETSSELQRKVEALISVASNARQQYQVWVDLTTVQDISLLNQHQ